MPCGRRESTRMPCGASSAGEVAGKGFLGGLRRTIAAVQAAAGPRGQCGDGHDHPRFVLHHAPCGQARGQKVRSRITRDGQGELLDIHLDQGGTQYRLRRHADRVERDIDAPRFVDHRLQMLVHRLLVQGVDLRRLGGAAGRMDFRGNGFHRLAFAPGQKQRGAFLRKSARDSAADRAAGSVNHRNLVFQHHLSGSLIGPGAHTRPLRDSVKTGGWCSGAWLRGFAARRRADPWIRRRCRHRNAGKLGARRRPPRSPPGRCPYEFGSDTLCSRQPT